MPPKQLTPEQESFLADLFPGTGLLTSPERVAPFSADASRLRAMPLAVVRPETAGQVAELLRWADTERMPLYPRARGTGTVGNAVPAQPGIVVSMLAMNRILDIDERDFVAVVQPGVITGDLQRAVAEKRMFYPPDPASSGFSTVGGNVSTCAGGLRAVKYGVTRDYVLGLEAVLPGGRTLRSGGRSHKDVVGLDLTRLFAGSAGKLGLITELTLKLLPRPETTASVLAGFSDIHRAMEGAAAVFGAGILPAALEFMDKATLSALELAGTSPLPREARAALLVRVDGSEAVVRAELERLETALRRTSPAQLLAGRGEDEEALWDVRRGISPASFNLKPDKLSEDIAVPRGRVAEAVDGVHAIAAKHSLTIMCFGHLGDGNIHVNIMHNASWPEEAASAARAKDEVFGLALSLGGTISGEHGTGLTKADYVARQLDPLQQNLMTDIKRLFDPHGIMNPGKGW
ncbi:FAD-binding oxidoreductase [Salidesulfovibrio onnuriiensis]|uniref:FAD-binding oxidoreductase n=1 Tax=Salidesulfovibrio onnuriiensis TaxID=2583823 RepID=UPI0011CA5A9B|nr:FAD-linked oxidase C-terminal domain-containing protein [Salidesulfovibrio onnuriiensis]